MAKSTLFPNFSLVYSLLSFILGTLILNINVSAFFASSLHSEALAVTGSVGLLTYIPETLILCVSYAIQNQSARNITPSISPLPPLSCLCNGLMIACAFLIPMTSLMLIFPTQSLSLISQDIPLNTTTILYFRIFIIGLLFKSFILCLRGFYAAQKSNLLFFFVIAVTVAANFLLNGFFLASPTLYAQLNFAAIGLSYCISMLLGFLVYLFQLVRDLNHHPVQKLKWSFCRQTSATLLKFMLPLSLHNILDHFGTMQIFILTEKALGLTALASMHLLATLLYLFPGMGFGLTALTFVSQAYGKKDLSSARKSGNYILLLGSASMGFIGLILFYFTESILAWMTPDLALRTYSTIPLQMLFLTVSLHVACQISMKCLQAIDKVKTSVSINLAVIYAVRLPAMAYVTSLDNPTMLHFQGILLLERVLKLTLFQFFWHYHTLSYKAINEEHTDLVTDPV